MTQQTLVRTAGIDYWQKSVGSLPQVILVWFFFCFVSVSTHSDSLPAKSVYPEPLPPRINFQHLLENKDIALEEAHVFWQDSQGFMWIGGGGGLIRYDGYEFKFVLQTVQKPTGPEKVAVKMIQHIYEDKDQILWIATRTGALRYDPRTELLIPIPDDPSSSETISTSNVYHTLELPSGELLLSSGSGIFVLDKKTLKYTLIVPDSSKQNWLHDRLVSVAYQDKSGAIWLGTGAGIEKLDWASKTFILFKPVPDQPNLIEANTVLDLVPDRDGTFWLATNDGLVNFNPETAKTKRYVNDPSDPHSLAGKAIAKVMIDRDGVLWVASDGGGIAVFEKSQAFPEGRFTNHKHEEGRAGSLSNNQVRTVYEDNSGDIWVGNYPVGINYFDRSSVAITSYAHDQSNPQSLSFNAILAVRAEFNQNLWIGTDGGGLNYFDRANDTFTSYKNVPGDEKSLSGNAVLDVFLTDDGKVWCGTWGGGISIFDPVAKEFSRMPFDSARPIKERTTQSDRINSATVWTIKQDRQKNIWLGSHASGLSKYDPKTKMFTHYVNVGDDPKSISRGIVWYVYEDLSGGFWVGTATGLDLMDRATGEFTHFKADPRNPKSLSNPAVLAILEDSKNRFWVGTEGGLHLMDRATGTFTNFDKSAGLNDDSIRTILEGQNGMLWLATNNGVSMFDPETKKVKNYNRDSGRLIGAFHTDSGVVSDAGEIIFGGVEGLRIIDPNKLQENKVAPPVAFTGLKIFADNVVVGGADGLLPTSLSFADAVTLDYQKTMFQFSFAALNYRDSSKNNYSYMLEGFDNDWLRVGDQRSAKYTNLNPGTYVFRVIGSNNDGVWNNVGTSIKIVQLPPPWKTWWAYTLYILMIIGIIVLFVNSQRKKRRLVEQQNRLLEIKVAERTQELREKNNDIKAMLSNMRQGLFTIESNGCIHPEYSHFLEEIFETTDLAGRNALELLFKGSNIGSNAFDQIKETVFCVIGEDEMNFGFNSHLLIQEYDTLVQEFDAEFAGKKKFLSLDWNPITVGKTVTKLMVSVRDVTLIKKMEDDARSKKRELDIISQLLNVPSKKYLAFVTSTKRFIEENNAEIECHETRDDAVIALLFRNMHTVKGNCRTFNFTYFSDVVHDVESVYTALKARSSMEWDRDRLRNDLLRVNEVLAEYERVYFTVLGRDDNSARDPNGFWADSKDIETIQQAIETATKEFPQLNKSKPLLPIQAIINRALSSPISEVLDDIVNSLPSIALQLGKAEPKVVFKDQKVRIKSSHQELMTNIFAHILRNSVDHGIEKPEVRAKVGKSAQGTIDVRARVQQDKLFIHVTDDGQGMHIDRLFKKGVEIGKWKAEDSPSFSEVADLIFASGVTTKEQISNISGRGVGMDAVKEFLLEQGGAIHLNLLDSNVKAKEIGQGAMVPFELVVELPQAAFSVDV